MTVSSELVPMSCMNILSLTLIIFTDANPCIHLYPDSTIGYILNNINIDSSIYYLGNKQSTNECQNSCIHFNYLCNTSYQNLFYNEKDTSVWNFNNDECSITASIPDSSALLLTENIISNEYIIELQLTILSNVEAGIIFKAKKQFDNNYRDYYFAADALPPLEEGDTTSAMTGYTEGNTFGYNTLNSDEPSIPIEYNTMHNISVHVINTIFTTYFNGEAMYTHTQPIDESMWTESYAGIYGWDSSVVFHSFKIIFPNNTDEKRCAAYIYDTDSTDCYGYYGENHTVIETSILEQSKYDSAIMYYSATCTQTINGNLSLSPSNEPSSTPLIATLLPTTHPSDFPSQNPSSIPSTTTTATTTSAKTLVIKEPTVNPTSISLLYSSITFPGETSETREEGEPKNNMFIYVTVVVITVVIGVGICAITGHCLYKYIGQKYHAKQQENMIDGQKHVVQKPNNKSKQCLSTEGIINDVEGTDTKGNDINIGDDEFIVRGDDEMNDSTKCETSY